MGFVTLALKETASINMILTNTETHSFIVSFKANECPLSSRIYKGAKSNQLNLSDLHLNGTVRFFAETTIGTPITDWKNNCLVYLCFRIRSLSYQKG